ncbi:hypothetical protein [Pararhodobacter zhoushanensis]|uniref:Uncharacterized protein n=1 Tax=Pararhodobacter zhoushanensis TaxID=2479545 RepID=A0ABT3GYG3_9RHOB|nr:hypothetical protein [Pararhodobacter zhoushanensis]MCW1932600.1 hypothetical protein [Pararhodobacter zhoushanensis]
MTSILPAFFAQASSALAIMGMLFVMRAFWPLTRQQLDPFGRYTVAAVILLVSAKVLRSLWWDWARVVFGDSWPQMRDALGGVDFNAVFNLMVFAASVLFLRARLYAIPEPERARWRWWSAWAHPGNRCIIPWRKRDE